MVKPGKKLKKTICVLGITGAVYVSFKYLLSLVIPFLIAYIIAAALRPPAVWLEEGPIITGPSTSNTLRFILFPLLSPAAHRRRDFWQTLLDHAADLWRNRIQMPYKRFRTPCKSITIRKKYVKLA